MEKRNLAAGIAALVVFLGGSAVLAPPSATGQNAKPASTQAVASAKAPILDICHGKYNNRLSNNPN